MSLTPEMERKIRQCVGEVLETLGKKGKRTFFSFLEKKLGLEEEEIPQKPELFSKGLNLVFGERGGDILETTIVQKLMTDLRIDPESKLTLVGAIVIIKATREETS